MSIAVQVAIVMVILDVYERQPLLFVLLVY